jgi:hypothetical protein
VNERIKLLAEQAGYTPLPGFDFANSLQEVFIQKFAELIVRECCDMFVELRTEPADLVALDVKTHFGVEE